MTEAVTSSMPSADLNAVAARIARELSPQAAAAGATLTVDALPRVAGDADALYCVLEVLVAGAVKRQGDRATQIRISATPVNGWWLVSVIDGGGPLSAEDNQELMQSVLAFSPTPLAKARAIVHALGGRVWAEARDPRGVAVHFTLPPASEPAG